MIFRRTSNNAEIAPCIISKAKFALRIKPTKPYNLKTCSFAYWEEAVEVVAEHYQLSNEREKSSAKSRYAELCR